MSNLSYQEKSIWSSLIVIVAAAVYFFGKVFGAIAAGTPLPVDHLARLGLAVVVIIVAAEVALHVAISFACREAQRTDERDVLIRAKAARNAYYVLIAGLMTLGGHVALVRVFGHGPEVDVDLAMSIVFVLFALVVAEVIHFASQLYYHRWGV